MVLMLKRTATLILTLVTVTSCSSVAPDLIRGNHLHLEKHDTDKVRAIWISVQERESGIEVSGALRRNDHTGGIIRTHVDVTVLGPNGKVLAEERSSDQRIPCNRVGAGSQRFKYFAVPIGIMPPKGSLIRAIVHAQHE